MSRAVDSFHGEPSWKHSGTPGERKRGACPRRRSSRRRPELGARAHFITYTRLNLLPRRASLPTVLRDGVRMHAPRHGPKKGAASAQASSRPQPALAISGGPG
jgi:hypothetical protein